MRAREGALVRAGDQLATITTAAGDEIAVSSPITGQVVAVEVRAGDATAGQTSMFRIAPACSEPVAVMLFPAARIADIALGQRVAITINGVARDKYGQAVGRVQRISAIPISQQRLRQLTGDASLTALPSRLGPLREVRIALTRARHAIGHEVDAGVRPAGGASGRRAGGGVGHDDRQTLLARRSGDVSAARARTPTVLQMQVTECGAASLGMVLGHYGRWVPLEELRERCGASRDGTTALDVIKAAAQYGLEGKGYYRRRGLLEDAGFPLILFWRGSHFLVLEGLDERHAWLNDPASGPRRISVEEFDRDYSKVCIALRPTGAFQPGGRARPRGWAASAGADGRSSARP